MKKIIITLTLCVAIIAFWSCEKETEGIATGTVYYPVFVNSGQQLNVIALGENFDIPEVTVFDGSIDITSSATVEGNIDVTTPGYYKVTYSATTSDGYSDSYDIIVFVYDPDYAEAPIAGTYDGARVGRGGGTVEIEEFNKGVYKVSDVMCGYYTDYVYPDLSDNTFYATCRGEGYFIYVGNNTFIQRNVSSPWGPMLDLNGIAWDPATGILTWQQYFTDDGYDFGGDFFTLTPVTE